MSNIQFVNSNIPAIDTVSICGTSNSIGVTNAAETISATYDKPSKVPDIGWIPIINIPVNSSLDAYITEFYNAVVRLYGSSCITKAALDTNNRICINDYNGEKYLIIIYSNAFRSSDKNMAKHGMAKLKLMDSVSTSTGLAVRIPKYSGNASSDINDIDGETLAGSGDTPAYGQEIFFLETSSAPEKTKFTDGKSYTMGKIGNPGITTVTTPIINDEIPKTHPLTLSMLVGLGDMTDNKVFGLYKRPTKYLTNPTINGVKIQHNSVSDTKLGALRVTDSTGTTRYVCTECSVSCNNKCSFNSISDSVGCNICGDTCVGTCSVSCEGAAMVLPMYGMKLMMYPGIQIVLKMNTDASMGGGNPEQFMVDPGYTSCGYAKCGMTCSGTCGLECSNGCYGGCTGNCGNACKTTCEDDSNCNYYASDGALFGVSTPKSGNQLSTGEYIMTKMQTCRWCKTSLLLFPL